MPKPVPIHRSRLRTALSLLLATSVLTCPGCWWFNGDDAAQDSPDELVSEEEDKKKDKEDKEKRDFEIKSPIVLPGGEVSVIPVVKPGHWAATSQEMTFHKYDFLGKSTTRMVDFGQGDIPVAGTPFFLRSTRPVVFSKGRPRKIESLFFVPVTKDKPQMLTELRERRSGTLVNQRPSLLVQLAPSQYLFVVLAKEPARYGFLQHVDSVKVPFDGLTEMDDTVDALQYRVVQPDVSQQIPLADNPLAWTSIAYVLWDEVDPGLFTPEQQDAMLDWLAWGGQLVINGPDSLDLLNGSFLEPYLPAVSNGSRNIVAADLEPLNQGWLIRSAKAPQKPLVPDRPWSGVVLEIHDEAQPLPATGELLVERSVGRGRIVVSAMQLSERELINWNPHFQSWLNACVLRRHPRQYHTGQTDRETLMWADDPQGEKRFEARRTSNLQYFVRDSQVDTNYRTLEPDPGGDYGGIIEATGSAGGVAAWNDFSGPATAATKALRDAAGVEVPSRMFVVVCVAGYLVVLVPLNWLFFRAIGRVEWAWIAAPVIAVLHTFIVVNRAQLDIGFVRAQTEIGVLELQPGHARGHLTRFTALYTSLSTSYDLEFDNRTTLAAPLGDANFKMVSGISRSMVDYHRHDIVRLSGVQVGSNSTSMVHSEQMFALDGPIQLGLSSRGFRQIENRSQHNLRNVGIVRRVAPAVSQSEERARFEGLWIGELTSRESRPVSFLRIVISENETPFASERERDSAAFEESPLKIEKLMQLAYAINELAPGETRLVGQIDDVLPGETIEPPASQVLATNLVVAHLAYGPRPTPVPDHNGPQDVVENWKDEIELE